jgi:glycine/sarcosine N-methyltransferase
MEHESVLRFYDALAPKYAQLFADWHAEIERQSVVLDLLLRQACRDRKLTVLDAACGIGTQALGLASRGHSVVATDLSPRAVQIATENAAHLGLREHIQFHVLPWLELHLLKKRFDAVCLCDNALPHVQSREEMLSTLAALRDRLCDTGVLLVSTRDYDRARALRQPDTPPYSCDFPDGERVHFQLWEWLDESRYLLRQFMLTKTWTGWSITEFQAPYRAWTRMELSELLEESGFKSIRWLHPEQSGYFQPLMLAARDPVVQ